MNIKKDLKPSSNEQANNTLGIDGLSTHPNAVNKRTSTELPIEFGRYRLLKVLGEGGMGAVYLAHDTELDRKVALKLPHFVGGKSKDQGERFRREARLAATLSHPNICRIFDIGEHDAQMYLTMEYIEGKTLNDVIKAKGAIEPRTAVNLVKRIASAVQVAHAQGIIHRDLKPANIMIKKDRDFVIMDFGLARRVEQEEVQLTATGAVLGTPAYMAPEQLRGENNAVGPQSDVYSLGIILYELLTGQRPFQGSLPQIYAQVLSTDSVFPSSVKSGLDTALDEICRKATSADTGMRYRTAEEFAKALGGYLAGQSQAPIDSFASAPSIAAINAPFASYQPTIKKPKSVLTTYRKPIAIGAMVGLAALLFLGAFLFRRSSTGTVDDSLAKKEVAPPATTTPVLTPSPNTSPPTASSGQSLPASTTESPNATSGQEQENNTKVTPAQNDSQRPGLVWSSLAGKTRWWSACYSPTGNFIAAGEQNPAIQQPQTAPIRVWPLSSDQNGSDSIVLQHPVANSRITSLVFSSDGKLMASAANGSIALWDMESTSPSMITSFQRFDATIFGMAFSPDGRYFASGSVKTSTPVIVWDIADPKKPKEAFKLTLPAPDSPCAFDFSNDSKTLFISSGGKDLDGHLFGWTFKADKVAKLLWTGPAQAKAPYPRAINVSPDGSKIAIAHGTQSIVLQANSGKQIGSFGGHASNVQAIDWTPDGSECYSASYDQTIRRWNVADGKETWRNNVATGLNEGFGVSTDGKFGFSSGYDMKDDTLNVVQFWRLPNDKQNAQGNNNGIVDPVGQSTHGGIIAPRQMKLERAEAMSPPNEQCYAFPLQNGRSAYVSMEGTGGKQPGVYRVSRSSDTSSYREPSWVVQGRHLAISQDERYAIALDSKGVLCEGLRSSPSESFDSLTPIREFEGTDTPKSPSLSSDGLTLVFQRTQISSGYPNPKQESGRTPEFVVCKREGLDKSWGKPMKIPMTPNPIYDGSLTWPMMSDDGLVLTFSIGTGRSPKIGYATRTDPNAAFDNPRLVVINGEPLVGRAPKYVKRTQELYYSKPTDTTSFEVWVVKNFEP
jgi:serine/threonine protein kinase